MEQVDELERFLRPDAAPDPSPSSAPIDLRFDVPVIDLRADGVEPSGLDLDFGVDPQPHRELDPEVAIELAPHPEPPRLLDPEVSIELGPAPDPEPPRLRDDGVVIDLRDDHEPVVVIGDRPIDLFDGSTAGQPRDHLAAALSLPTVGMWTRPDRCLPVLVNRARFRQGGVTAVSAERIDLTELAVLASRRGDVHAHRLARLARLAQDDR
jgi:hypothetical protein